MLVLSSGTQGGDCRTSSQQCAGLKKGPLQNMHITGVMLVSALVTEHSLQGCGSSSIFTPGVLQANDETVGSPGSMNQGYHWDFIHLMAPGHKKFNIFLRKLTCRNLKR